MPMSVTPHRGHMFVANLCVLIAGILWMAPFYLPYNTPHDEIGYLIWRIICCPGYLWAAYVARCAAFEPTKYVPIYKVVPEGGPYRSY